EEADDDPSIRVMVHGAHVEVGVVLLDHLGLKPLTELLLPAIVPIPVAPLPVSFTHLPIGARERVSWAGIVVAAKAIPKLVRYLLQLFPGGLLEQRPLSNQRNLRGSPFRILLVN